MSATGLKQGFSESDGPSRTLLRWDATFHDGIAACESDPVRLILGFQVTEAG